MQSSLTIAVDVDDTVANLLGPWLARYNREYNDILTPDDIKGWALVPQIKPECGEKFYEFLDAAIYNDVLPLPGARQGIYQLLAAGHRVVYVTSCVRDTADAKLEWLRRWGFLKRRLFEPDFIAASDKSLIGADVLFDDHIKNVESFPRMAWLASQPHNAAETCARPRVRSMLDASFAIEQWKMFSPYRDAA